MADAAAESGAAGGIRAVELVCTEVWGGNRRVDVPIQLPGMRGHLFSLPAAGNLGGDVHCLSICGSGLISRLCLADVVGHGAEVAAVGGEIHRLLRGNLNALDQRRILAKLNRRLSGEGFGRMTTAALATYFPPSGSLSISYAGHPPAWIFRAAEQHWQRLEVERRRSSQELYVDVPLGIETDARFNRRKIRVATGDRLLMITDGALEAQDDGATVYGAERLAALLTKHVAAPPRELIDRLLTELGDYAGDAALPHDDITLLLVEFVPGPRRALWEMVKNRLRRPRGNVAAAADLGGYVPSRADAAESSG